MAIAAITHGSGTSTAWDVNGDEIQGLSGSDLYMVELEHVR